MIFKDYKKYVRIPFTIHEYSSYSSSYKPENILCEEPGNPSSRWSTSSTSLDQYITLKLLKPSIVTTIVFGKYCKVHVCNVKEIKVYSKFKENEVCVLKCCLKNDNEKEIFNLEYATENKFIITEYIKLNPLSSWGMNFNYSLWYIELRGYDLIDQFINYNNHISFVLSAKLVLKFLKKHEIKAEDLITHTKIESEAVENVKKLVEAEKFEELENFLENNVDLFEDYVENVGYKTKWEDIGNKMVSPRGGHQLVEYKNNILLYGGWDGEIELNDMWIYDTQENKWTELEKQNLPGKRSCHKMINIDDKIYLFGKYISVELQRQSPWMEKEIFIFDKEWQVKLFHDGPNNLFDHQMVGELINKDDMDLLTRVRIYIFGGRCQNDHNFSGLFCLENGYITSLRNQSKQPQNTEELYGRVGHSLILIPENNFKRKYDCEITNTLKDVSFFNNSIVIIGGQKGKENFKEMTFYNLETDTIYFNVPFPFSCDGKIVQRAILKDHEIIIHFSFAKEKEVPTDTMISVYNLKVRKWLLVTDTTGPAPRTAHQFIYCNNVFYLFGGNPGQGTKRSNDFWKLFLTKSSKNEILNEIKFIIRRHRYLNICDKKEALMYLKNNINPLICENLQLQYKNLCCEMIKGEKENKNDLILKILNYFPKDMCRIVDDIEDFIK